MCIYTATAQAMACSHQDGTVQELIPDRNAIGTNAQGYVIVHQLQPRILKAFAQYNLLLRTTLKFCCFRSVCSRIAGLSLSRTAVQ